MRPQRLRTRKRERAKTRKKATRATNADSRNVLRTGRFLARFRVFALSRFRVLSPSAGLPGSWFAPSVPGEGKASDPASSERYAPGVAAALPAGVWLSGRASPTQRTWRALARESHT